LHVRTARTQRLDQPTGEGWLAVGDAAMSFDPLSSEGISKGLVGEKSRRRRCGAVPRRLVSGTIVPRRYQYGIRRIPGDATALLCGRETVGAGVVLATPTAPSEASMCGDMKLVSLPGCSRRNSHSDLLVMPDISDICVYWPGQTAATVSITLSIQPNLSSRADDPTETR
jgi:hypothetical protein